MFKKVYEYIADKATKFNKWCVANDEFVHMVVVPMSMVVIGLVLEFTGNFIAGTVWIVGYFIYSRINVLASKGY